eukprot:g19121.t1
MTMTLKKRIVVAVDLDEVLGRFLHALCGYHNASYQTNLIKERVNPFPETCLKECDTCSYRFCDVWGGSNEEATEKVHAFFETDYFKEHLEVLQDAQSVLRKWAITSTSTSPFDFFVVTSRQHVIIPETKRWLETHFPGVFQDVLFGNHWARGNAELGQMVEGNKDRDQSHQGAAGGVVVPAGPQAKARSKAEMCSAINAEVLIDDSVAYVNDCLKNCPSLGVGILFGEYGWNKEGVVDLEDVDRSVEGKVIGGKKVFLRCTDWAAVDAQLEKLAKT